MSGKLSLLATPIGNLEDMTFRAVRILKEADFVAAEDTRRARILLDHYGVTCPVTSYHMHNEHARTQHLLDQVLQGKKIALLTDAGTPAIADPGFFMVRAAIARGIEPEVIPGVSALTYAAVAAGFPVENFIFGGFLPMKSGKRRRLLEHYRSTGMTLFLFESPYKMERLLKEIIEVFGPAIPLALVREATKMHEEVRRASAQELLDASAGKTWKGEFVVVVHARAANQDADDTDDADAPLHPAYPPGR